MTQIINFLMDFITVVNTVHHAFFLLFFGASEAFVFYKLLRYNITNIPILLRRNLDTRKLRPRFHKKQS